MQATRIDNPLLPQAAAAGGRQADRANYACLVPGAQRNGHSDILQWPCTKIGATVIFGVHWFCLFACHRLMINICNWLPYLLLGEIRVLAAFRCIVPASLIGQTGWTHPAAAAAAAAVAIWSCIERQAHAATPVWTTHVIASLFIHLFVQETIGINTNEDLFGIFWNVGLRNIGCKTGTYRICDEMSFWLNSVIEWTTETLSYQHERRACWVLIANCRWIQLLTLECHCQQLWPYRLRGLSHWCQRRDRQRCIHLKTVSHSTSAWHWSNHYSRAVCWIVAKTSNWLFI